MHGPTAHPTQRRLAHAFSAVRLLGPPMGDLLVRLVAHLFTPAEAEAALALTWYRQQPLSVIAARAGRTPDELEPLLDSLYERGVIYRGKTGYALLPLVPGMFEYLLMGGGDSDWYRAYARMFVDLFQTGYVGDYTGADVPAVRNVPDARSVAKTSHVVDDDLMAAMLAAHDRFAMLNVCQCRHTHALNGDPCSRARAEDGCLIFGEFAQASIAKGKGRSITRAQMRATIAERRERKLVFLTANVSPTTPNVICTCCDCCCHFLETVNLHGGMRWVAPPRYVAAVDEDRCAPCGHCPKACNTEAHRVRRRQHRYDPARCVGCGNCVDVCPEGAITMEPSPSYRRPSRDFRQLGLRLMPSVAVAMSKAKLARWRR